jgi:hypothetical protein
MHIHILEYRKPARYIHTHATYQEARKQKKRRPMPTTSRPPPSLPHSHLIITHLLLLCKLCPKHTQTLPSAAPTLASPDLEAPIEHLPRPPSCHHHTRDDIHQPHDEREKPTPFLRDGQRDGLDIKLHKHARDVVLANRMALTRSGILVRLDGVLGVEDGLGGVFGVAVYRVEERQQRGVVGVDGRHDGEVVLEFVEVLVRGGDGVVERVGERRVVGAEGELVYLVREVEGWSARVSLGFCWNVGRAQNIPA